MENEELPPLNRPDDFRVQSQAGLITAQLSALVLAVALNLLFPSWPALRAARMDPIRALRHEWSRAANLCIAPGKAA